MEGFIIPTAEEMKYLSQGNQSLIYDVDFAVDPVLGVDIIHLEVSLWVESPEGNLIERRLFRTPNEDACYVIVFKHFYNRYLEMPDYEVEAFTYGSPSPEFNDAMVTLKNTYNVLGYNKLLGHVAHSITNS